MTDTLDELFADLRADAVLEIRPPGVAAARRTVRRRRTTTAVASGCAVILAIAAGFALTSRPSDQRQTPVVAATSAAPADPVTVAQRKLAETSTGTTVVDVASPVIKDYEREQKKHYLGNLTLRLACAGQGRITFAVMSVRNSFGTWGEHVRLSADCATDPVPAETVFAMTGSEHYQFRLIESTTAPGAGFAFRITADTGTPIDAKDWNRTVDPQRALELDNRTVKAATSMRTRVMEPGFVEAPGVAEGRYRIAMACAGAGTAILVIRLDGRTVARAELECTWQITQKEFEVGNVDERVTTALGYRSDKPADGLVAWAWIRV
ncbi:hypothetical protein AB0M02_07430 [Actinoplanes sp. NPDC051861]|uniref:hypothetical protein n=1 Tax=Actinoplanes sp. NPDC051861 TaxID=3155170 RepID=UPI003418F0F1